MKTFLLTSALILVLVQPFESAPAYADRKYMEGYGYGEENQRTYNGYEGGYDNDDDEYRGNEYESSSKSYGKAPKLADVIEVNVIIKSLDQGYDRKNSYSTDKDGYSRSIGYAPSQRSTYGDDNTYGSRSYDDDSDSYKMSRSSYGGAKDSYNHENDSEYEDEYEEEEEDNDKDVYLSSKYRFPKYGVSKHGGPKYGVSKYGAPKYAYHKSRNGYNDRRSYKMKNRRNGYGKMPSPSIYSRNKYY